MLFFHMLRQNWHENFVRALRQFYKQFKFKQATLQICSQTINATSGQDFSAQFEQWVHRAGAPDLLLRDAETERTRKDLSSK